MSTIVATESVVRPKAEATPEELLAMPDGGHYELIDGEQRERNMRLLSGRVAVRLAQCLDVHCEEHNLGCVVDAECGYQCFPWQPSRVRRADVSFIGIDRLPSPDQRSRGYVTIPPDLAVEVVSPNDRVSALDENVDEYLRAGVRLVWIINPEILTVQVLRGDGSVNRLRAADELSGEDVIPGFRCKVDDLFPKASKAEAHGPTKSDVVSTSPTS
jgi:Uma2 family endonuclease